MTHAQGGHSSDIHSPAVIRCVVTSSDPTTLPFSPFLNPFQQVRQGPTFVGLPRKKSKQRQIKHIFENFNNENDRFLDCPRPRPSLTIEEILDEPKKERMNCSRVPNFKDQEDEDMEERSQERTESTENTETKKIKDNNNNNCSLKRVRFITEHVERAEENEEREESTDKQTTTIPRLKSKKRVSPAQQWGKLQSKCLNYL